MKRQCWGGGPEPWPDWPAGQHWPGSCWGLPAQRHSTIVYGTILQLIFIHALAHAQWSFYNWGFSKKLYYPNQLASSSSSFSSSSSSSFLKTVITSRSVFGLLWSFSFPGCLWAQLQVVALQGTLESNLPPELEEHCRAGPAGGAPRQMPCCESRAAQGWAEAVAVTSFFQFSDCIWVQTGGFL